MKTVESRLGVGISGAFHLLTVSLSTVPSWVGAQPPGRQRLALARLPQPDALTHRGARGAGRWALPEPAAPAARAALSRRKGEKERVFRSFSFLFMFPFNYQNPRASGFVWPPIVIHRTEPLGLCGLPSL